MEHKTGLEDYYVIRGQKKMRFGYTTGSCAAAACKGACLMLLGKEKLTSVPLMTLFEARAAVGGRCLMLREIHSFWKQDKTGSKKKCVLAARAPA